MAYFPIRKFLIDRKVTIGSWIQAAHPANAEVLANAGYDWIALECEHSENDIRDFATMARAIYGRGPAPLARVRDKDPLVIRRTLDMGAMGVFVPMINSAADARQVIEAARYPPKGKRGYCLSRMNDWGASFEDYLKTANDQVAIILMIESNEAVDNIDSILQVDGVDGVFIGPYDLSASFGVPGQTKHPDVIEAKHKVLKACQSFNKAAGLHIVLPDEASIAQSILDGFTFLCLGSDIIFMNMMSREMLGITRACTMKNESEDRT